ncbi:hypothetical protein IGI37_001385 [Enterococcus sp. AZ194]|uniref:hypothetical protein n=1 Tax=Enterococcus sp. AZ194 TaxID=2774629 RepID=UPI003F21C913
MRHQKYDAAFILKGAYQLALKKGIDNITSRGLAKELDISTQPIYLSFQNIEEVKEILTEQILTKIQKQYFKGEQSLSEFLANYCRFIQEDALYYVLFADNRMKIRSKAFLFNFFEACFKEEARLTTCEKQILFSRMQGMISVLTETGELSQKMYLLEEMIQSDSQLILANQKELATS